MKENEKKKMKERGRRRGRKELMIGGVNRDGIGQEDERHHGHGHGDGNRNGIFYVMDDILPIGIMMGTFMEEKKRGKRKEKRWYLEMVSFPKILLMDSLDMKCNVIVFDVP